MKYPRLLLTIILPSLCLMGFGQASANESLSKEIISILKSRIPAGIAKDEDLTNLVCPLIGKVMLSDLYKDMKNDAHISYSVTDNYDILSIERYGGMSTTELRILRGHSDSKCTALLFNKYL